MKNLCIVLLLLSASLFAANTTPVAVSSVAVSGNTVTVNATAHALAVNQGFCLTGGNVSANAVCGVVATVPTGNQFTFSMTGPAVCAATCGTVNPAPQVISLSQSAPSQGQTTYTYLLWLTTQQPCPGPSKSTWVAANGSAGSSQSENNAIAAGYFVESTSSMTVASNTPIATVQLLMQNDWTMHQQALSTNIQPCQFYGFVMDPGGWAKQ